MMNPTRILILGGYGNTGRPLARLLLQHTDHNNNTHVILAGRHVERAEELVEEWKAEFGADRVSVCRVDASNQESIREALQQHQVQLLLVASGTAQYVENVAGAVLLENHRRDREMEAVDYMDVQCSTAKTRYLQSIAPDIASAGACFITDGGFHPGLPAAMIRFIASEFDKLQRAHVGSVIQMDWKNLENRISPETMEEFAGEFMDFQMLQYKRGEWRDASFIDMMRPREMEFCEPFGRKQCFPCFMEEMRAIPKLYPSVEETGFYVGGLNWVVDWFVTPIVMVTLKIWPHRSVKRAMGRFLYWGLRTFSKPPFGTLLKLEASGTGTDGSYMEKSLEISHQDGYALTAIPVAATVLQYLDGAIRRPGLWYQANIVDPKRLMVDMSRMGAVIQPPPVLAR